MNTISKRYNSPFSGVITALVTPFKDNFIDVGALEKLVLRQVQAGVAAIVPCGTTGEGFTLNHEEYQLVVETCVKVASGKIKVIAGSGSNSTFETLRRSDISRLCRTDALLVVTPYYNKPPQDALKDHFLAVAAQSDLPIILYNIPSRTGVDMTEETVAELFAIEPKIVGLKDSTGNIERVMKLKHHLTEIKQLSSLKQDIDNFAILSGEDSTAVAFNAAGGNGVISVLSNLFPKTCVKIYELCKGGDYNQAQNLQQKLFPITKLLFRESNPIPVKFALSYMGFIKNELRQPLRPLSMSIQPLIIKELEGLKDLD